MSADFNIECHVDRSSHSTSSHFEETINQVIIMEGVVPDRLASETQRRLCQSTLICALKCHDLSQHQDQYLHSKRTDITYG